MLNCRRAAERFPHGSDVADLLQHLAQEVLADPQNLTIESVARWLLKWLNSKDVPLDKAIPGDWLALQVLRPLPSDAEVFLRRDEAEGAVMRAVENGVEGVTPEVLDLSDQLIRLRASQLLDEWVSM